MSIIEKAVDKLKKKETLPDSSHAPRPIDSLASELGNTSEGVDFDSHHEAFLSDKDSKEVIKLPVAALKARGMVTTDRPRSQIAEEYRMVKRPLLTNIAERGATGVKYPNLIMITSALQGEGKTFTAVNLAMSMSMEQGKNILLVDSDFSKATVTKLLDIPQDRPGLINILEHSDLDVGDVILRTDVPNLRVIPAGQLHERSTELLASEEMQRLMVELAERYPDRVIIFDSPPLLLTTESSVLASLVGQIVFVVSAENTSKDLIDEALEYIGRDKVIGMLLNKTKRYLWDRYRYGYTYGYGYYQSDREAVTS